MYFDSKNYNFKYSSAIKKNSFVTYKKLVSSVSVSSVSSIKKGNFGKHHYFIPTLLFSPTTSFSLVTDDIS